LSSPRITRLENDYQKLRQKFDGHPYIVVEPLGSFPPQKYRVVYKVPSLRLDQNNTPVVSNLTVVDFELPSTYPRDKPRAVALEKVFHPNFDSYVCIADFWSPAQSLADIVLEVGEMLQWQKYNILSPLNAPAANWAVKHQAELPVGHIELGQATVMPVIKITSSN
jgi:ubiquitin-protein ligase